MKQKAKWQENFLMGRSLFCGARADVGSVDVDVVLLIVVCALALSA